MVSGTAVLTVDLIRGHMDPSVGTLPVDEDTGEEILENTQRLVETAEESGYPVIHITTEFRDSEEILWNPKWSDTDESEGNSRESISEHAVEGTSGSEVMPRIRVEGDRVILPKKRYSAFIDTDLEFVLSGLGVETLLIAGVNTNTCVQCTCFEATNRDYEAIVVEECVGSMDGEEFHQLGLKNIDHALGYVRSLDSIVEQMEAGSV